MKKLFISLFVIAAVSLTSCGGGAKTETPTETPTEAVTLAPEVKANDVVTQYADLVEKCIPLVAKGKAGDAAALAEVAQLTQDITKLVQDNQEAFTALSEVDAKRYQELVAKFASALK